MVHTWGTNVNIHVNYAINIRILVGHRGKFAGGGYHAKSNVHINTHMVSRFQDVQLGQQHS